MVSSTHIEKARPLLIRGIEERNWKLIEEAAEILRIGFFRPQDMACNKNKGAADERAKP